MKKLNASQQKVLDFILKSPASKAEYISEKIELTKPTVGSTLKLLIKGKKIKELDSPDGKIYVPFDHDEVKEETLAETPAPNKEEIVPAVKGIKIFQRFFFVQV